MPTASRMNVVYIIVLLFCTILLIFVPIFNFKLTYIFYLLFWIVMAASFNIIYGLTGYLPFGFVAFYGVGGYTVAIFIRTFHFPVPLAILMAGVMGILLALFIFPTLRLQGIYFAIVNLAVALMMMTLVSVLPSAVFGGSSGLTLNSVYHPVMSFYYMLVLTVLVLIVSHFIMNSRLGIALKAIKQDQYGAEVVGINTTQAKLYAWLISAFFPSVAGAIDALFTAIVAPESAFNVMITAKSVLYGMFGGFGTVLGPILGTFILYQIDDLVWRFFPGFDVFLLGLLLLLFVLFFPRGIIGSMIKKFPKTRFYLR